MSLADPQSITISAVTTSLPRVSSGTNQSSYQSADGDIRLSASSTYGRRTRRVIRIDHSKFTTDPFIPANNTKVSMSNFIVFDVPPAGYTNTEALAIWAGFKGLVTASSDAAIVALLGGQS